MHVLKGYAEALPDTLGTSTLIDACPHFLFRTCNHTNTTWFGPPKLPNVDEINNGRVSITLVYSEVHVIFQFDLTLSVPWATLGPML